MARQADNCLEYSWERLDTESTEAYEAFSLYRDGWEVITQKIVGDDIKETKTKEDGRSLLKVSQRLSKSLTLIKRWSARYEWVNRTRDYDRYIDALALRKAESSIAEMRARHIKIGQMLQTKGLKALDVLKPEEISAKHAISMVVNGMKYEEDMSAAELAAHTPVERESAEEEALQKLDDILGRIKSGF